MVSILLNARLTSDSDGYVRRITLEFISGKKKKYLRIDILPGMTKQEVMDELQKVVNNIESECETDSTELKQELGSAAS